MFLLWNLKCCTAPGPNISPTPLRQWGFQLCLPFRWTTLWGKHCGHPIAVMGVVDTFRPEQSKMCTTRSGMPLFCVELVEGFIFILSSQTHWYTCILWLYPSANSCEENIVIARLQGKSSEKLWWHISKHAWYVCTVFNQHSWQCMVSNTCTLAISHIWNTFYGANEMFSWKIEVNLNWPL